MRDRYRLELFDTEYLLRSGVGLSLEADNVASSTHVREVSYLLDSKRYPLDMVHEGIVGMNVHVEVIFRSFGDTPADSTESDDPDCPCAQFGTA